MTISTLSGSLYQFLLVEVISAVKKNIAGIPGFELRPVSDADIPLYICCIEYQNKPYALFALANPGNTDMAAKSISSILHNITLNHPSVKMAVRLELGGLDYKIHNNDDVEARVHRVA